MSELSKDILKISKQYLDNDDLSEIEEILGITSLEEEIFVSPSLLKEYELTSYIYNHKLK